MLFIESLIAGLASGVANQATRNISSPTVVNISMLPIARSLDSSLIARARFRKENPY